jgi:group I intron endonuclease
MEPIKTRKQLQREYKDRPKPAGVFQVRNLANGKILLGSSLNLDGPLNSHKFMLKIGRHRNEGLQQDWDRYGEKNFAFEVIEVVKVKDDLNFNPGEELTLLEQVWLEKLKPFGDKGYNRGDRIRQA